MVDECAPVNNRPLFVELVGPAGAGKTTLAHALQQKNQEVRRAPKPSYRFGRSVSFFVRNAVPLMPVFFGQRSKDGWLTWREIWWMTYLNGWDQVLGRQRSGDGTLYLLDHGPVYMLTSLLEFGPGSIQGQSFREWWDRRLKAWALLLDVLVWLDAPNAVLANRINARNSWHVIKEAPEQEMSEFLTRYRSAFERVIALSKAQNRCLEVLRFHTAQEPPEQIAEQILRACETHRSDANSVMVSR